MRSSSIPHVLRLLFAAVVPVLIASVPGAQAAPRVVVLGFDGADAEVTARLMAEGRLPNLQALAEEGSFRPLLPTNPPQTPVSWSTFATGLNPGRTEIFDFIKKDGRSYSPTLCMIDDRGKRDFLFGRANAWALALLGASVAIVPLVFAVVARRARRRLLAVAAAVLVVGGGLGAWLGGSLLPREVPRPINNRKGSTFWELATSAGLSARIVRVPATFPADRHDALTMISGLGVPDVRGLNGQPTLFTTHPPASGGQFSVLLIRLDDPHGGPVEVEVPGPRNLLFPPEQGLPPRLSTPARFQALGGGRVRIEAGDRTSELAPGQWSDWHVFEFRFNALVSLRGMGRFYNESGMGPGGPDATDVVLSPIHFHPDTGPMVGWCHPGDHGSDLAERIGPFKTMGWAIDTWTVSEDFSSDQHSLEDAWFTADGFERLMEEELGSTDADLYVQVFAFTDRIQHVFWRLTDPEHPRYDAALAERHGSVVEEAYERMDSIVGRARALAPADAVFMVLSDHGFSSFRRGVNLNRWLVNHGFMVLRRDPCVRGTGGGRSLDDLFEDRSGVFSEVDWSRTRAYAMGLGNVYVNLAGREPEGIVRPGREYEQLVTEISAGLEGLVDPATGERPVRRVYRRDVSYSGYDPEVIPDLRVANEHGYRVSWDTVLGGIPCEEVVDNDKAWGADHCSLDPELVKGILFANRELPEGPEMVDVMPTILRALGLAVPPGLDGESLL